MAKPTLSELQTQLSTVQAAISTLLKGEKITQLRVGSGTFQRLYVYQEISLESLRKLQNDLLRQIDDLEAPDLTADFFGKSMTIPLVVRKEYY